MILAFDSTSADAFDEETLEGDIKSHDWNGNDNGSSSERSEDVRLRDVGATHPTVESNRHGPIGRFSENHAGQNIIGPGGHESHQGRIDDDWLGERKVNLKEDPELIGAIKFGGFVDIAWNRVEISFTDKKVHASPGDIINQKRPNVVDETECLEDHEDGNHRHKAREHAKDQSEIHDEFSTRETETRQGISADDSEKGGANGIGQSDKNGIKEPILEVGFGEKINKIVESVSGREKSRGDKARLGRKGS